MNDLERIADQIIETAEYTHQACLNDFDYGDYRQSLTVKLEGLALDADKYVQRNGQEAA